MLYLQTYIMQQLKIWDDRKAVPLTVLRPHDGQPVCSATFLNAPHRPDHIVLITGVKIAVFPLLLLFFITVSVSCFYPFSCTDFVDIIFIVVQILIDLVGMELESVYLPFDFSLF